MNKDYFFRELKYLLGDLSEEEREEALQYYEDYLDEAGPEREQEVLKELGSPEKVAAEIKSGLSGVSDAGEFTERGYRDERFEPKGQMPDKYTEIVTGEVVDDEKPGSPGERILRAGRRIYEYGRSRMEYETGSYREADDRKARGKRCKNEGYEDGSYREADDGRSPGNRRGSEGYEEGSCRGADDRRAPGNHRDGNWEEGRYHQADETGGRKTNDKRYGSRENRETEEKDRRRADGSSGFGTDNSKYEYGHYRRQDGGEYEPGREGRGQAGDYEERRELQRRRRKGGIAALILFLVFGLPLGGSIIGAGFSLVAAIIGGVFGIFGGLLGLVAGGFAAVAGLMVGGIGMIISGFVNMASPALGTAVIGGGFFLLALAMLLLVAVKWGCTTVVPGFFRFCIDLAGACFRFLGKIVHRIFGGGDR